MPKHTKQRQGEKLRNRPLAEQITADSKLSKREGKRNKNKNKTNKKNDEETFISSKQSQRILQQAKEQRKEIEEEKTGNKIFNIDEGEKKNMKSGEFLFDSSESESDIDNDDEKQSETNDDNTEDQLVHLDENGDWISSSNITEAEERIIQSFIAPTTGRTLSDLIMEKLQEREMELNQENKGEDQESHKSIQKKKRAPIPRKVVNVYSKIGTILSTYTSGKLPKAFKIIPSLSNWEEITFLTRPDQWSPHATFAATKLFISNLNEQMTQRFLNLILLEKVREDIRAHKKLNYHLYHALKKAIFKPAAFVKGILLPLAQCQSCTLREATIVGSVVMKVSIPIHHSAAALMKLSQFSYNGATSTFIRILLNKKYNLFHSVIDQLVQHFLRFCDEKRQLPVIWHQSLLIFAQRYKQDITKEQKNQLKVLLKAQYHYQITPEIRRELFNSVSRGEEPPQQPITIPAVHNKSDLNNQMEF